METPTEAPSPADTSKPRTVMLPEQHYRALALLMGVKGYRSRSDVLKQAIEDYAVKELGPQWANPLAAFSEVRS